MPEISIILPVKNQQDYIEKAIDSVYSQTHNDFELIVIDDGSTDETSYILEKLKKKYGFKLLTHKKNLGIVKALNNGLDKASGNYIARMDGDDIMLPERLEKQIEFLNKNPELDLIGTQVEIFKEYEKPPVYCGCRIKSLDIDFSTALKNIQKEKELTEGVKIYQKWNNSLIAHEQMLENLYIDCPIVHPTFFAKKEFFEKLGGYAETEFAEDYDLVFRAVYSGFKLGKVPEILLKWRDHENRETRTNKNLKKDKLFFQKAYFFKNFDKRSKNGVYVIGVGKFGKKLIGALKHYEIELKGVLDFSGKRIRGTVRGIPLITPEQIDSNSYLILAYSLHQNPNEELKQFFNTHKKRIIPFVL
ncbi:glycosyl transferase family 2 [Thermotomaculum hydrothermale]|uniref:Glycosyl transferase family 2 n=1 Tax=Thermotomaculum hydrothermale TaxID=981385 RepID=A0A7R6PZN4_9BACT|nr:glycosyltransferase [Thermotomaculum hydrothermale]BBB32728.1 glycosyl transferase family 2 [Thermotomaculum hydrothermale]